jgi:formyl-CoA transferase
VSALAGVMSVTGEPGGDPVKCGVPVSDLSSGLFCAVAILSALHARERTGRGQSIDTSLFEGAAAGRAHRRDPARTVSDVAAFLERNR